jgi:hypothetical protein
MEEYVNKSIVTCTNEMIAYTLNRIKPKEAEAPPPTIRVGGKLCPEYVYQFELDLDLKKKLTGWFDQLDVHG